MEGIILSSKKLAKLLCEACKAGKRVCWLIALKSMESDILQAKGRGASTSIDCILELRGRIKKI
ncbi:MAG: hypothetical protein ACI8ZB_002665 [Desulforhopalus sp.]|jgi:hypothetical protein